MVCRLFETVCMLSVVRCICWHWMYPDQMSPGVMKQGQRDARMISLLCRICWDCIYPDQMGNDLMKQKKVARHLTCLFFKKSSETTSMKTRQWKSLQTSMECFGTKGASVSAYIFSSQVFLIYCSLTWSPHIMVQRHYLIKKTERYEIQSWALENP